MGVLDDAIREHLDLKRKHGVPEEELQRQEEEALGPVRREVAPPEEDESSGDGEVAAEAPDVAAEGAAEPAAGPELPPFDGESPFEQAEPHADELEPEPFAEEPFAEEPFAEEPAPTVPDPVEPFEPLPDPEEPAEAAESERAAEAVPDWFEADPDPSADHPPEGTRRFDRESHAADGGLGSDAPAAEDDEPGAAGDLEDDPEQAGDVLEDTPDFLEETPEHDRLWFEQKPPRDFDFD